MSTNKTQNYQLHSWEAQDDFLRTEINENFSAIDALVAGRGKLVTGSYIGDDMQNREIDLGGPILALILENSVGQRGDESIDAVYGGMALPGLPLDVGAVKIQGSRFILYCAIGASRFVRTNIRGETYVYLAWVDLP